MLIVAPSFPRNVWIRGNVLESRLAKERQARRAKILASHGILERPAAKIAVLDLATRLEYDHDEHTCRTVDEDILAPLA